VLDPKGEERERRGEDATAGSTVRERMPPAGLD